MTPITACVLRSGGSYDLEDVMRLRTGVEKRLGGRFVCFTDAVDTVAAAGIETVPLTVGWPGWWSKLNLFAPAFAGDLFYLDLDTIIVGPLADLAGIGRLAIMRDVYRPYGLQSSVMVIPQAEKAAVWERFIANPDAHMDCHRVGGDQTFLETLWLDRATRFQDALPGQIVSYKADRVWERGVPDGARAVVFHGRPRPREIGWELNASQVRVSAGPSRLQPYKPEIPARDLVRLARQRALA